MKLEYYLFDPTKNVTALCPDVTGERLRQRCAAAIMEKEPSCEQAGFVYVDIDGQPCLSMAGNEFCGNASMCAGAYFCIKNGIGKNETQSVLLKVSGAKRKIRVDVTAQGDGSFLCKAFIPKPERIIKEELCFNGKRLSASAVYFDGITHLIIRDGLLTKDEAQFAVRLWCGELKAKALGLMLTDEKTMSVTPLVYVPQADTLFWESSCASGTCAIGAYVAQKNGKAAEFSVKQPGGTLSVKAGEGPDIILSGGVSLIKTDFANA